MNTLTSLLKLLLPCLLLVNQLNLAHACSPAIDEEPASIAEKAQNSTYVFDAVVTNITETYIELKVTQYFKGRGESELKIVRNTTPENSCADQFVLNQRGLFFTQESSEVGVFEQVDDGSFASVRGMNAENFSEITAITKCMGTYSNANLNVPCILHQGTQNFYQANLKLENTAEGIAFTLVDVLPNNDNLNPDIDSTSCIATYTGRKFIIPCIAHPAGQTIYQSTLKPTDSAAFAINALATRSNIQYSDNFDTGEQGSIPNNWQAGLTGGGAAEWALEEDSTAPSSSLVLKQSGNGDYPWCINKDSQQSDGFVATKFKAISGNIDQAAGLIWRWKDADNYYVARANALEDNISIYYVKGGTRYTISYIDLPKGQTVKQNVWQSLRVDFHGDHFLVSFEGKVIVNVRDSHIKGTGAVGVWTKEDSVTSFDDFRYGW